MKRAHFSIKILVAIFLFIIACNQKNERDSKEEKTPPQEIIKPTEDIVFALDVSSSMLAQDFVPNRLDAVKSMLKKMISEKEPHQQIALILFAGESFILCPLTKDTVVLIEKISLIDVDKIKEGTAIGSGIMLALYELSKSNSDQKSIFVLTDGVNNSGEYTPSFAAQIATQSNIKVHSFGVGCNGTAIAPIAQKPDRTYLFGESEVKIDEEILKAIGETTQGNYLRVTCSADLESLESLNSLMSNSKPISSHKSDVIPNETLDSIWSEVSLKNEAAFKNFNTIKTELFPEREKSKKATK